MMRPLLMISQLAPIGKSDHNLLFITLDLPRPKIAPKSEKYITSIKQTLMDLGSTLIMSTGTV